MNSFKSLKFSSDSRQALLNGAKILSDAVKVTLGPGGMNVVIEQESGPPLVTKDGVTVARAINLREKYENLGAQIIKDAASRACEVAGDGTTTATVLTYSIFSNLMGVKPNSFANLKRGALHALSSIQAELESSVRKVETRDEIVAVGTISANGESEIGELIAQAFEKVGKDGIIAVEDGKGFNTCLEITDGTEIDRGFISPYFVTDAEKMQAVLANPYVFITNRKISTAKEIIPILEKAYLDKRPLLVVADDVDGEALQSIFVNKTKGIMQVCVIRAPEFGEGRVHALEDLASLVNAKFEPDSLPEAGMKSNYFGTCEKVIIDRTKTIFVKPNSDMERMQTRLSGISSMLENPALTRGEKDFLARRRRRLVGCMAILRVGGATETEMQERRDRVDDALHAVRAALSGGILPGGGTSLYYTSKSIAVPENENIDFKLGFNAVVQACKEPLYWILTNAGLSRNDIAAAFKSTKFNTGFDASTIKWCDDLIANGIIDPHLVIRSSIENSVSAAIMLASVGAAIVADTQEIPEQST